MKRALWCIKYLKFEKRLQEKTCKLTTGYLDLLRNHQFEEAFKKFLLESLKKDLSNVPNFVELVLKLAALKWSTPGYAAICAVIGYLAPSVTIFSAIKMLGNIEKKEVEAIEAATKQPFLDEPKSDSDVESESSDD